MLSTQSLRDKFDEYADGALSSEALEEWLASESWDMRRWAPRGLQRLVEALQVAFIERSNNQISEDELHQILLQRRAQLHEARRVSEEIRQSRAAVQEAMVRALRDEEKSLAGSEALIIDVLEVSAA